MTYTAEYEDWFLFHLHRVPRVQDLLSAPPPTPTASYGPPYSWTQLQYHYHGHQRPYINTYIKWQWQLDNHILRVATTHENLKRIQTNTESNYCREASIPDTCSTNWAASKTCVAIKRVSYLKPSPWLPRNFRLLLCKPIEMSKERRERLSFTLE